ncbi:MAG: response regulator transcription factor [Actinobacteria bacterium]|nr:response regulator transcription factor [Actinomycetota bacterium]
MSSRRRPSRFFPSRGRRAWWRRPPALRRRAPGSGRGRRQGDARERLREALAIFEELGAEPWTERARTELRGTGETARRGTRHAEQELTAQELQVALTIAGGATNREAAAALFLSPKTIEYHLTHIYAKLNLRSRSELARRFARDMDSTAEGRVEEPAPARA